LDTASANFRAQIPDAGSLGPDAQQASAACEDAAGAVTQMDVGDNALAQSARDLVVAALVDAAHGADYAAQAATDVASGQYESAISALQQSNDLASSGHDKMSAAGNALGIDLSGSGDN
jgi:hypothetical protein